jgi:hypothetical protein
VTVDLTLRPTVELCDSPGLRFLYWRQLLWPVGRLADALRDRQANPWRAVFLRFQLVGDSDGEKL